MDYLLETQTSVFKDAVAVYIWKVEREKGDNHCRLSITVQISCVFRHGHPNSFLGHHLHFSGILPLDSQDSNSENSKIVKFVAIHLLFCLEDTS